MWGFLVLFILLPCWSWSGELWFNVLEGVCIKNPTHNTVSNKLPIQLILSSSEISASGLFLEIILESLRILLRILFIHQECFKSLQSFIRSWCTIDFFPFLFTSLYNTEDVTSDTSYGPFQRYFNFGLWPTFLVESNVKTTSHTPYTF